VAPPQRPGAQLWSIAAGPLVNLVLVPVLAAVGWGCQATGLVGTVPGLAKLFATLAFINMALLLFNLLPIYPLDGGQILRALLWFVLGPATSLIVAAVIGLVGVTLLFLLAIFARSIWIGILAVFILSSCWHGLQQGLAQLRMTTTNRPRPW